MKSEELELLVSNILSDERFPALMAAIVCLAKSPRFSSFELGDFIRCSLKKYECR